jgi:hypothetical protein
MALEFARSYLCDDNVVRFLTSPERFSTGLEPIYKLCNCSPEEEHGIVPTIALTLPLTLRRKFMFLLMQ